MPADLYVVKSAAGDPNNFVYDVSMKGINGTLTLNADDLGWTSAQGYSIAVYVAAIDEGANEFLNATLKLEFSTETSSSITVLLGAMTYIFGAFMIF